MLNMLIRALVVSTTAIWPLALMGQGLQASLSAPAPRLAFSESEMTLARAVANSPELADFYGSNGLKAVFTGAEAAPLRQALITAIGRAGDHGLPAQRYEIDRLRGLDARGATSARDELAFARVFARWTHDVGGGLVDPVKVEPTIKRVVLRRPAADILRAYSQSADPAAVLAAIEPQDPRYKALQRALGARSELIAPTNLPQVPDGLWKPGAEGQPVLALRARLSAIGINTGPASLVYDAALTDAVRDYQQQAGLGADGVAGPRTVAMINRQSASGNTDIAMSMERMRWLTGLDLNARHVWVNLPSYTAQIRENGAEVFDTRVVIGKQGTDYRTPEFSDEIEFMVANPRWNVPRSMTVRDYLPKLQANRNAVSHLDVVDGNGNVVPRDRINFSNYSARNFPFRLRQKPSDDNALGLVKFMFPNPWNIYLHDTPSKGLFNNAARAASNGCIRIGRPFDLAHELLKGNVDDPEATFKRAVDSGRETYLNLKNPVPVHLVYFTALPDDSGKIRRYPDIYDRDPALLAAFERAALEKLPPEE